MKKILGLIFSILLIISCSKKEEVKLEAFSPEAFAYDLGDSWEVNATVNARGFEKTESGVKYFASLSFSVDLEKPDGSKVKEIFKDEKKVTDEELNDIQLEVQFELDSAYSEGTYSLYFNIKDNNSNKTAEATVNFDLEK